MSFWNQLIATALLGTEKQSVDVAQLPAELQPLVEKIRASEPDREAQFLKTAALAMNYERAGRKAPILGMPFRAAEAETLPFCSERAVDLLKTTLTDKWTELLELWLQHCAANQLLAPGELLPELLNKGTEHTRWADMLRQVTGKRGLWIARFNPGWHYLLPVEAEEIWTMGTVYERKQLLARLRQDDPAKARVLLQSTWKEEKADSRAEFLAFFEVNLLQEDIEFISEVYAQDKSQKVKAEASRLLLQWAPGGNDPEFLWQMASSWLKLEGNELALYLPDKLDAKLKSEGIAEKGGVGLSNQEYWLYQLIERLPLERWESHFNLLPEKIIELLVKKGVKQRFVPAFASAAIAYKNVRWMKLMLENSDFVSLMNDSRHRYLAILSPQEREYYAEKNLLSGNRYLHETIQVLVATCNHDWSAGFTKAFARRISQETYTVRREWYQALVPFMHKDVIYELASFEPADEYRKVLWREASSQLCEAIVLREEIKQVFAVNNEQ